MTQVPVNDIDVTSVTNCPKGFRVQWMQGQVALTACTGEDGGCWWSVTSSVHAEKCEPCTHHCGQSFYLIAGVDLVFVIEQ